MNILVTGGAGFIGSHFIKHMLTKYNYMIINLDNLTYSGNLNNVNEAMKYPNYQFIRGNICDRALLSNIFSKYEIHAVINIAAETHVDRSIVNPSIFVKTNIEGTQALLDVSKQYWITEKSTSDFHEVHATNKFIQISTDEVYGTLGDNGYFTEETNLAPNSPYSASKAAADMLVRAYFVTYGLPINITRCSNNYGPYQYPEKLIPLMIRNALQDKELPLYGDGRQVRDWLHVKDHCRAIDLVLHDGKVGEVYNIGGNTEKQNIDIIKMILQYLEKDENLVDFVTDRLGHDRRYAIDSSKIMRELGWSPSYSFEEGIKETIEWYVNKNNGVLNVKANGME